MSCKAPLSLYSQVFDSEARGEAVSAQLSDIIVAEVQGFHRHQLSGPGAIDAADLIMMSGKTEQKWSIVSPFLPLPLAIVILFFQDAEKRPKRTIILTTRVRPSFPTPQNPTQQNVLSF